MKNVRHDYHNVLQQLGAACARRLAQRLVRQHVVQQYLRDIPGLIV